MGLWKKSYNGKSQDKPLHRHARPIPKELENQGQGGPFKEKKEGGAKVEGGWRKKGKTLLTRKHFMALWQDVGPMYRVLFSPKTGSLTQNYT
jgi:hypothetical protein